MVDSNAADLAGDFIACWYSNHKIEATIGPDLAGSRLLRGRGFPGCFRSVLSERREAELSIFIVPPGPQRAILLQSKAMFVSRGDNLPSGVC